MLVLDASVALAYLALDGSVSAWPASSRAIVPDIFLPEVLHVLVKDERRRRGRRDILDRQLSLLTALDIVVDHPPPDTLVSRTLPFARRHRLSIFDAAYLELAQRLALPLATLDTGLQRGAAEAGLPLA